MNTKLFRASDFELRHSSSAPRLLVTRIHGTPRLMLRVLNRGRITETVTAANAQLLLDYVESEWPAGTKVQWAVVRVPAPRNLAARIKQLASKL